VEPWGGVIQKLDIASGKKRIPLSSPAGAFPAPDEHRFDAVIATVTGAVAGNADAVAVVTDEFAEPPRGGGECKTSAKFSNARGRRLT
jgi:hypothetical protein